MWGYLIACLIGVFVGSLLILVGMSYGAISVLIGRDDDEEPTEIPNEDNWKMR